MTLDPSSPRHLREHLTFQRMLEINCRDHGHTRPFPSRFAPDLCRACLDLLQYADARLTNCPWGETKPQCTRCTIHCYKPDRREEAREVMRYAGPRMMLRHPVLTVLHIADRLRRPVRQPKAERALTQKAG